MTELLVSPPARTARARGATVVGATTRAKERSAARRGGRSRRTELFLSPPPPTTTNRIIIFVVITFCITTNALLRHSCIAALLASFGLHVHRRCRQWVCASLRPLAPATSAAALLCCSQMSARRPPRLVEDTTLGRAVADFDCGYLPFLLVHRLDPFLHSSLPL